MNKVFCIKYLKIDIYRIFNPGDTCMMEDENELSNEGNFIFIKGQDESSEPYYGYRFYFHKDTNGYKFDEYFCDYKSPKIRAIKLRKINE
jgi:hypothetical protein